ncbi:Serine/threonine-protein kinase PRP4-like protein [Morus notabilis]|uniref:Serine/threonine-protein kinase PRP4-like protein n=1 Tax=Morus notabilis TaxID=981085 RepID=W9RJN3_9ROSA|nr:Serine/threonine-protein kinase PRP4-like protein [Morus notabilis]
MAGDAQDSHKHHRSPSDDDTDKSSKRHKHRHHHRHRHHHHRHSSRKRDEEIEAPSPPPAPPYAAQNSLPDDDVEEGEILDEEGFGGGLDGIPKKKSESDAESGEIEASGVRDHSDKRNLGLGNGKESPYSEATIPVKETKGSSVRKLRTLEIDGSDDKLAAKDELGYGDSSVGNVNGALNSRSHRRQRESGSPSKRSNDKRSYYDDGNMEVDGNEVGNQMKSSSQSTGEKYKGVTPSPLDNSYHHRGRDRSRSRSYDRAKERSRSHSVMEDEAFSRKRRYLADKSRTTYDTDSDRTVHGRDVTDMVRDDDRKHSPGYRSKYIGEEDKHGNKEARTREESREREGDRDRKREKERARSRDRDIDRDRRRQKERERSRDRESDRDWRREKERERSRDRELDRDRRRERVRYRSRDREVDRDRKYEKERDRSRDRVNFVERSRDSDRERRRERDKYSDGVMERKLERRDDGSRDKLRDRERDKHENDIHRGQDGYRHSRSLTYDERDISKDGSEKVYPTRVQSSKANSLEVGDDIMKRDEDRQEDFEETYTLQLVEQEEEDLNRIKEESRRRRQAILEKYKSQQLQQQSQTGANLEDAAKDRPGPSTAPSSSRQEIVDSKTGGIDVFADESSFSVGKSTPPNGAAVSGGTLGTRGLGEGTPKSERSDGMFCDDIFGETPTGVRKSGKGDGVRIERSALHDNWDDAEGYYSYRFGELLDGRYEITAAHGKGVFSTVVRAKNVKAVDGEPEEVAIKIIRSNDTMYKAGMTELVILKKLVGQDPENKRHCVRFLSSFKYRNHLCLVFESLHMNLREVLKKFGRNIGLKLTAVRAYAKQLFIALKHLKNCGVLHCDIKPDNMLVKFCFPFMLGFTRKKEYWGIIDFIH